MAAQRPAGMAAVAITDASRIPLPDDAVDAALAVLTIHHWPDLEAGIAELRRVARRIVILTWDDHVTSQFWLFRDYLPTSATLDHELCVPISRLNELPGTARIEKVPVPHDCLDGFACAYWRQPEAYLDARIRANTPPSSASKARSAPASIASQPTSPPADGTSATPTSSTSTRSTSATASSSATS